MIGESGKVAPTEMVQFPGIIVSNTAKKAARVRRTW